METAVRVMLMAVVFPSLFCAIASERVSFGQMVDVTRDQPDFETMGRILSIQQDQSIPDYLIITSFSSIDRVNKTNGTLEHVLGEIGFEGGFKDGSSEEVQFRAVTDLAQMDGYWIVVDSQNSCLRKTDLATFNTVTYAGFCEVIGELDGTLLDARFHSLQELHFDPSDPAVVLAVQYGYSASDLRLKSIDTVKGTVRTLMKLQPTLWGFYGLAICDETRQVLLSGYQGIAEVSVRDRSNAILVGTTSAGDEDGSFDMARFQQPAGLIFLSQNLVLVADSLNNRLRVLDLVDKTVTSVCDGAPGRKEGDRYECQLNYPWSLHTVDGDIYVGQQNGIKRMDFDLDEDTEADCKIPPTTTSTTTSTTTTTTAATKKVASKSSGNSSDKGEPSQAVLQPPKTGRSIESSASTCSLMPALLLVSLQVLLHSF